MAYDTYDNLKVAVLDQAHRGDLLSRFDNFLAITEVEIRSNSEGALKLNLNEKTSQVQTSTVTRLLPLPVDFQSSRNFTVTLESDCIKNLIYRTPDQMVIRPDTGTPIFFTVRENQIEFDILSDVAYTTTLTYTANLSGLSSTNQTNNVLTKYPNIYLFGCLKQIYIYTQDIDQATIYDGLFSEAIDSANNSERDIKYPTQPEETVAWSP